MRVLFDQGTPVPLRQFLQSHEVETAFELGWSRLDNGDLLAAADRETFDVFVTTDRSLPYQQNLVLRKLAVVVLTTTSWPRIRAVVDSVAAAVDTASPGSVAEVEIP